MTENQFTSYLLLILITIQNVCQLVIPPNEKYLYNSSTDSFHQFYLNHLTEIEIVYRGKSLNVCYPRLFNNRNVEIKDYAINLIKEGDRERGSFSILMKAAEIIEDEEIQLYSGSGIILFLKRYKQCITNFNLLVILISTLYLLIYKTTNLSRSEFDPVSVVLLFISFIINVANCIISCLEYYQQTTF